MGPPVNESALGRPAPPLRPFVDRYIGYRQEGFAPGVHRGLPSRHLTFIVSLADPVDIAGMPDAAQAPASYQASWAAFTPPPPPSATTAPRWGCRCS